LRLLLLPLCLYRFAVSLSLFPHAVSRFFVFQVFATFIYQFVVGSALGRAQELIKDPSGQIVNILGVSAVQTSSFFMSFVSIQVSVSFASRGLRGGQGGSQASRGEYPGGLMWVQGCVCFREGTG
jgi:hypothetical protein